MKARGSAIKALEILFRLFAALAILTAVIDGFGLSFWALVIIECVWAAALLLAQAMVQAGQALIEDMRQ